MAGVSVLGTGLMGSALARAFMAAGHHVVVWNRTASSAELLAKLEADQKSDAAQLRRAGRTVVETGWFCDPVQARLPYFCHAGTVLRRSGSSIARLHAAGQSFCALVYRAGHNGSPSQHHSSSSVALAP